MRFDFREYHASLPNEIQQLEALVEVRLQRMEMRYPAPMPEKLTILITKQVKAGKKLLLVARVKQQRARKRTTTRKMGG
jgi:hypothetical protein